MSEATTITISRSVPVPPERAFAAWVDPEELAQWWWPQWPDTTYDLDVRAGGHYRMHSAAAGFGVTGELTVVEPPHRLAMTWIWTTGAEPTAADDAVVDLVEVTFEPDGPGTRVNVRHTSTEHVAEGGAEQGWNDVMDRLPPHLSR